MKREKIYLEQKFLIGLYERTSNALEFTGDKGKIATLFQRYFENDCAKNIPARTNPGVTIAAYTEFENNEKGFYTYVLGEEVGAATNVMSSEHKLITIPAGYYIKFTTDSGPLVETVINAWKEIWAMDSATLGGQRSYLVDYEVYDKQQCSPNDAVIDIYIGVNGD